MHNFGVPSVLKLWIDQIARVEKTFSYANGTPKGLIIGKKATFIIATGGIYDAQTQMASFNFVEPYLRSLFGFLGLTDVTFLTAGGTMALNHGQDRDAFLAPHLQAVQTLTAAAGSTGGLLQATNGILYGTTDSGGTNRVCGGAYCGTVFSLDMRLGKFVETVPTAARTGAKVLILGKNLTGVTAVTFKVRQPSSKSCQRPRSPQTCPLALRPGRYR